MRGFLGTLLTVSLILGSNITAVALAFFSFFTSKPDPWTYFLVAVVVGFLTGSVVGEVQLAFVGSLGCFVSSLIADAILAGAFTYLYETGDGAVRQVMAELFLQKVLLAALVVFLPVYLLSWVVGALFSEFLVR